MDGEVRETPSLDEQALEDLYLPQEGDQFTLSLAAQGFTERVYEITKISGTKKNLITYEWMHKGSQFSHTSQLQQLRKLGMTKSHPTAKVDTGTEHSNVDPKAILGAFPPEGYFYCGRCCSVIPVTYEHWCNESETKTVPSAPH